MIFKNLAIYYARVLNLEVVPKWRILKEIAFI